MRPPADLFDEQPAEALDRFIDAKKPPAKKRSFKLARHVIETAQREMDERAASGNWENARGVHLVALYRWLHQNVYGIEPLELDGAEWARASVVANRFCAEQFGSDFGACVEFMRWAWKREQWKENQRATRDPNKTIDSFRIGWRYQFSPRLVTDYRIGLARSNGAATARA